MPDDMDRVQERVDLHTARAIEAARPRGDGALDCDDCGEPIPQARRLAYPAARCCVRCQSQREVARGR